MPQYIMQIITAPMWIIKVRRVLKIILSLAVVKINRYCILSPDPHTTLEIAFQVLLILLIGYYLKLVFSLMHLFVLNLKAHTVAIFENSPKKPERGNFIQIHR